MVPDWYRYDTFLVMKFTSVIRNRLKPANNFCFWRNIHEWKNSYTIDSYPIYLLFSPYVDYDQ